MVFNFFKTTIVRFKDLGIISIANILSGIITGIFWLVFANILGEEIYGEISYSISIAIIATSITLVGLPNPLIVLTEKNKIQSTFYFLATLTTLFGAIILFLITESFTISLLLVGIALFLLFTNNLIGKKQFKQYLISIVTQKILFIVLSTVLFYSIGKEGILLGLGISFFPFVFLMSKELRKSKIDLNLLRKNSKFISANFAFDLSKTFTAHIDKIIIFSLFGAVFLGNYHLGFQILGLITIFPNAVFLFSLSQKNELNFQKFSLVILIVSVVLVALTILLAPIIFPILWPEFEDAILITQIMIIAIIPMTFNSFYISKFIESKNLKPVIIGSLIVSTTLVLGIILLGEYLSISGAALSVVIATILEFIYLHIKSKDLHRAMKT